VAKHSAYSLRLTPRASRRGGFGLPVFREPAFVTSAARMAERQSLRVSRSLEGEGERPATGYGEPEAGVLPMLQLSSEAVRGGGRYRFKGRC
jgi:alkylation response protein AidB-like acyl-CoA dehydrogenase